MAYDLQNIGERIEKLEHRQAAMETVFSEIVRAAFLSQPDGQGRLLDAIALAKECIRTPSGLRADLFDYIVEARLEDLRRPPANH